MASRNTSKEKSKKQFMQLANLAHQLDEDDSKNKKRLRKALNQIRNYQRVIQPLTDPIIRKNQGLTIDKLTNIMAKAVADYEFKHRKDS